MLPLLALRSRPVVREQTRSAANNKYTIARADYQRLRLHGHAKQAVAGGPRRGFIVRLHFAHTHCLCVCVYKATAIAAAARNSIARKRDAIESFIYYHFLLLLFCRCVFVCSLWPLLPPQSFAHASPVTV